MYHQNADIKIVISAIVLLCCCFWSDIDDVAATNTLGFVGAFTATVPTTIGVVLKTKSMQPPPPVSSISSSNHEADRRRRKGRTTIATLPSISSPSRSTACFAALKDGAGGDDVNGGNSSSSSSDDTKGFSIDNSSASTPQRPNKLDLYGEDELASLLQLHTNLYPSMTETTNERINNQEKDFRDDNNGPDFPSLHDLVMQTIEGIDDGQQQRLPKSNVENDLAADIPSSSSTSWLPSSVASKLPNIRVIASDVDGTILDTKDQQVHPRTQQSIIQAVELARENRDASSNPSSSSLQWFFPATGKSRAGALSSLGPELSSVLRNGPGVYCQGLYCVGKDGKSIVFEKKLTMDAIVATEQLVEFTGTSIIAYDGDNLYTTDLNPTVLELHEKWGEPLSTSIPSIAGHPNGVHKILVCDMDEMKLRNLVRPQLEQIATETGSVVTQAIPTMLEILPEGCSKAYGVQKVCEELGIDDPGTQLLAIGDAENDVEMLQMASVGVAVRDANDLAKAAADVVVPLTSCEGGAGLTIEKVLQQKQ